MSLRDAAQQALEALRLSIPNPRPKDDDYVEQGWKEHNDAIYSLRAALADTQDWDEIEALRASLREHMAEIHRLRAAGRQALDAMDYTRWAVADQASNEDVAAHDKSMNALQAALAKYAAETNFGNMAQAVDCYGDGNVYRGQRSRDSETKTITFSKVETVEPVAYVTGYRDGFCVINPVEHVVFPTGMALYRSPPKREPLTESFLEELAEKHVTHCYFDTLTYARAIERAHNIGGEE